MPTNQCPRPIQMELQYAHRYTTLILDAVNSLGAVARDQGRNAQDRSINAQDQSRSAQDRSRNAQDQSRNAQTNVGTPSRDLRNMLGECGKD